MLARTILVVDDVPAIRAAMRIALEHSGLRVMEAENGRVALEQARLHLPDLVLMDLMMPVLDGWSAARVLRQDCRTGSIPVVAVTALGDLDPVELAAAGFCAHLRKPFTVAQVLEQIQRSVATEGDGGMSPDPLPASPRAA